MQPAEFKFERFPNPGFPVYFSIQSGRRTLVQIHHHTSAEIIQVSSGRVELFSAGLHRECLAGEIMFIPPSAVHEVTSLTEDASIRGVVYEPSLTALAAMPMDVEALFAGNGQMQYLIGPSDACSKALNDCMDTIQRCYAENTMASRRQIIGCLMQAEGLLIRRFGLEESADSLQYRKLEPVLRYLKNHYAERIRISDLSRIIHVCDDRLIRLFREVTGETPVSYLMNLRIEACLRLLSGTDETIAEIAEKTGFGSDTYMTRVFRQKLNTTPAKYRHR